VVGFVIVLVVVPQVWLLIDIQSVFLLAVAVSKQFEIDHPLIYLMSVGIKVANYHLRLAVDQ
jgi:hypothetical protein